MKRQTPGFDAIVPGIRRVFALHYGQQGTHTGTLTVVWYGTITQ